MWLPTWTNIRRTPGVLLVRAPLLMLLWSLRGMGEWAEGASHTVAAAIPGWERDDDGAP